MSTVIDDGSSGSPGTTGSGTTTAPSESGTTAAGTATGSDGSERTARSLTPPTASATPSA